METRSGRKRQRAVAATGDATAEDHSFRETVAGHYATSAANKRRLKWSIFFHYLLSFGMLAKLIPFFLDSLDIFILEIEELDVPKPIMWEFVWLFSLPTSFFALDAGKRNKVSSLRNYMIGIIVLGYLPLVYGTFYWMWDVWTFLTADPWSTQGYFDLGKVVFWKDYPYGLLWYGFILLALQVHSFSMYFSYKLMVAWKSRGSPRIRVD
ncbi:protein jagunal [Cylas formicarius]|uniref:protein jagunal n=1 Tax=Cylas formicarius TaxID=197179 RepID=UPI0029585CAE|nr:protein jagunal [Cylas formicarius]